MGLSSNKFLGTFYFPMNQQIFQALLLKELFGMKSLNTIKQDLSTKIKNIFH